jgi:hypothetical protein
MLLTKPYTPHVLGENYVCRYLVENEGENIPF